MARLSDQAIAAALEDGLTWRHQGSLLVHDDEFDDFGGAMRYANQVADLAEEHDHHPDIRVHGWNKVRLELSTHSEGGVTDKDVELARRVDAIPR